MEKVKKLWLSPHLCLICGVDSGPIRTFLIIFMGGLVLSSVLIMLWAWGTHRLGTDENFARLSMEAEEERNNANATHK